MRFQIVLIALGSAAVGSIAAFASHIARRWLAGFRMSDTMWLLVSPTVSFGVHSLGFVGLYYLAALDRSTLPVIMIAWIVGIGLMRRYLREI